jgi:hypothetical protein
MKSATSTFRKRKRRSGLLFAALRRIGGVSCYGIHKRAKFSKRTRSASGARVTTEALHVFTAFLQQPRNDFRSGTVYRVRRNGTYAALLPSAALRRGEVASLPRGSRLR